MKILTLTVDRARELDRRATDDFLIPSFLLMENAGHELAKQVLETLQRFPITTPVLFFCGGGNNGGDGYVAARYVQKEHTDVKIYQSVPADKLKGDAKLAHDIAERFQIPMMPLVDFYDHIAKLYHGQPLVIVDCLVGTGFSGPLRIEIADLINRVNTLKQFHNSKVTIIAADIPTGLNADTGDTGSPTFNADVTVAFGSLKPGLVHESARSYVGRVKVVDIGIPQPLIDEFSR